MKKTILIPMLMFLVVVAGANALSYYEEYTSPSIAGIINDTFDRPDNTTLGFFWGEIGTNFQIISNVLTHAGAGGNNNARLNRELNCTTNLTVSVQLTGVDTYTGLMICDRNTTSSDTVSTLNPSANCVYFRVRADAPTFNLRKNTKDTAEAALAQTPASVWWNYPYKVTMFVNKTSFITRIDDYTGNVYQWNNTNDFNMGSCFVYTNTAGDTSGLDFDNFSAMWNDYAPTKIPDDVSISVFDKYNQSSIEANITLQNISNTYTKQTIGGLAIFNVTEGLYNITVQSSGYTTEKFVDFNTASDLVANLTYYKARFNAVNKFISNIDNSTLLGFNISFYNKNTTLIEITTNSTNGAITVDLTRNNTFNVSIKPSGYEIKYLLIDTNTDYTLASLLYFYSKNSFNFIFLDEENSSIVTKDISLDIISDLYSQNYTVQNGTAYIDLLLPTLYALRYSAPSYNQRFYYYNLTADSFNNLTLWMNKGTNVTVTIYDEKGDKLEDAYVKVLRYDLTTNSYIAREIAKTDFTGEANTHLILNTDFYKFLVYYPFSTLLKTTSPAYITSTSLSLSVDLNLAFGDTYFSSNNVDYSLTYNTDSSNFRFSYSDTDSKVTSGCLEVYTLSSRGNALYDSSCVNSDTSTILISAPAVNGTTYEAKGYTTINNEKVLLDSKTVVFDPTQIGGDLGLLLVALLTILFAMLAYYSVPVALVITPLPMFLGSLLNIVDIPVEVTIPLELMCVTLAVVISKRSSQ